MKKTEFINLLKEYLNTEVRKIVREEIKIALDKYSPAINVSSQVQEIQKPSKSNQIKPSQQNTPKSSNHIQDILVETYRDMATKGQFVMDEEEDDLPDIGDFIPGQEKFAFNLTKNSQKIPETEQLVPYEDIEDMSQLSSLDQSKIDKVFSKMFSE